MMGVCHCLLIFKLVVSWGTPGKFKVLLSLGLSQVFCFCVTHRLLKKIQVYCRDLDGPVRARHA